MKSKNSQGNSLETMTCVMQRHILHLSGPTVQKDRDYKKREIDRKYRNVFVAAHVLLRTAAMFIASVLNRGSHPPEILYNGD